MNFQKMMGQMQALQRKAAKETEAYEAQQFTMSKAGGAISIVISGNLKITSITIDDSLLGTDSKDMLQDALTIAINEAVKEVETGKDAIMERIQSSMPKGMI